MLRTDLALEAKEMYHENAGEVTEIDGVRAKTVDKDGLKITTVEILNEKGKQALQKEIGTYITIEMPAFKEYGHLFYKAGSLALKEALHTLLDISSEDSVLVVGLGNRNITPDALGSKVTDKLIVTGHLCALAPEAVKDLGKVSCLAPGVMGLTGMETADIIKQVIPLVRPKAILAIDALAARSMERVSTTVQLSDTGISPGSGIGNTRSALCKETLGIPVIAIGVPMVVDAKTLAYDALQQAGADTKALEISLPDTENLLVTPKDVDRIITHMSNLVAAGINLTLHNLTIEQIYDYVG